MNRQTPSRYSFLVGCGVAVTFAVCVLFGQVASVLAAPGLAVLAQITQPAANNSGPDQPIDVVVVLDDSGSMATCWPWPRDDTPFFPPCQWPSPNLPSDPDELRYSAARLLLQLADSEDRVAVVRFDTVAEGVGALGSLQRLGDPSNRHELTNSLQPPSDYLRRGYTRLDLGLEMAVDLLLRRARTGSRSIHIAFDRR